MNGAECLIKVLEILEVEHIFGYPGGAIMPIYDALQASVSNAKPTHILCRHEQGCAFAAQGYARASSKVGVCLATSGPGATNLITGIADAHLDSIPLLVITGQVETALIGTDAFQAVDIIGMTHGIVKQSFQVTDPNQLADIILSAYELCQSGRPGPVLIDIPKDMQRAELLNFDDILKRHSEKVITIDEISDSDIKQFMTLLRNAERPVLIAGGGIKIANAEQLCQRFAETFNLPVATTLNCVGLLARHHPLNLGLMGMHGTAAANDSIQEADLLIAIGSRFDDRATGKIDEFAPLAKIIHIDIDASEHHKNIHADLAIIADAYLFLDSLNLSNQVSAAGIKNNRPLTKPRKPEQPIHAPEFVHLLSNHCADDCLITVDVGQHQMWVAQHYDFTSAKQLLSSSGLGTMGFGLPAAIGAQIACAQKSVINMTGDGSFMMNIQELATIKRYNLPIKIVLFNNQHLGLVRQQQELFYGQRYSAVDLSDNPDFVQLTQVFGFTCRSITRSGDSTEAINWLTTVSGPAFLEVNIAAQENVWPFVVPGQSNSVRLTQNQEQSDVA